MGAQTKTLIIVQVAGDSGSDGGNGGLGEWRMVSGFLMEADSVGFEWFGCEQ